MDDNPECVLGLVEMRRLGNVSELHQFINVVKWLRTGLPNQAEVGALLMSRLKACLRHAHQTKRAATRRTISHKDWSEEQLHA